MIHIATLPLYSFTETTTGMSRSSFTPDYGASELPGALHVFARAAAVSELVLMAPASR